MGMSPLVWFLCTAEFENDHTVFTGLWGEDPVLVIFQTLLTCSTVVHPTPYTRIGIQYTCSLSCNIYANIWDVSIIQKAFLMPVLISSIGLKVEVVVVHTKLIRTQVDFWLQKHNLNGLSQNKGNLWVCATEKSRACVSFSHGQVQGTNNTSRAPFLSGSHLFFPLGSFFHIQISSHFEINTVVDSSGLTRSSFFCSQMEQHFPQQLQTTTPKRQTGLVGCVCPFLDQGRWLGRWTTLIGPPESHGQPRSRRGRAMKLMAPMWGERMDAEHTR